MCLLFLYLSLFLFSSSLMHISYVPAIVCRRKRACTCTTLCTPVEMRDEIAGVAWFPTFTTREQLSESSPCYICGGQGETFTTAEVVARLFDGECIAVRVYGARDRNGLRRMDIVQRIRAVFTKNSGSPSFYGASSRNQSAIVRRERKRNSITSSKRGTISQWSIISRFAMLFIK